MLNVNKYLGDIGLRIVLVVDMVEGDIQKVMDMVEEDIQKVADMVEEDMELNHVDVKY